MGQFHGGRVPVLRSFGSAAASVPSPADSEVFSPSVSVTPASAAQQTRSRLPTNSSPRSSARFLLVFSLALLAFFVPGSRRDSERDALRRGARREAPPMASPFLRAQAAVLPVPSASPLRPSPTGPVAVACGKVFKRLLVLHDDPQAKQKFSRLFQRLRENFEVSLLSFPLRGDQKASLLFAQHGEPLYTHVLLLATAQRRLSQELAAALRVFFTSVEHDLEAAEAASSRAAASPSAASGLAASETCPPALRARNLFLAVGPSAHASARSFAASLFAGEPQAPEAEGPARGGSVVADYFEAVRRPQSAAADAQGEPEDDEEAEVDGELFVTRELLDGHPHVVEPLEADEFLLYRGGAHYLPAAAPSPARGLPAEAKERIFDQFFAVLRAPATAFVAPGASKVSREGEETRGEETPHGEDLALASARQSPTGGRAVLLSSGEFCADELLRVADQEEKRGAQRRFANLRVCEDLLLWTFNRRGVLRWSNLKHFKPGETVSPHMYRMKDEIAFAVDIHQLVDDFWQPFYATDVQVEFVMLQPFLRSFLEPPASPQSPTFSHIFQAPDRYGVFKFVLHYRRLGYTVLHVESLAPLRNFKSNDFPRFLPCALPYYATSLLTLIALVLFVVVFLLHREKDSPSRSAQAAESGDKKNA
ncbi:dolichyl-diphosphooligosaccharide--protein glycosyltransferase [Besnoitia besnoiti]|uniref:Dolichyl-diphosphooligosaccharide--protein glycosyltransferase n=1 Tax=Besnoitia besnoiti TaxID=94643 RepID=A0A2A9MBA6_BESBE|nr:dolichyl-diphosphooligosaccharide--protein glycosyltransferase [Besnoitia besnoiti]PFH34494.1 dolichyl-diphosphooligosaccharide--protein glycosyltransferase [Besnoitia besnoiti]